MRQHVDLSLFPERDEKHQTIYFADFGNAVTEIGHTNNLKGTMYRYLHMEEGCQSVWLSQRFKTDYKPVDPRLEAEFGLQVPDWEWSFAQMMSFADRAKTYSLSGSRFGGLPIDVVKAYARYVRIPARQHYYFN